MALFGFLSGDKDKKDDSVAQEEEGLEPDLAALLEEEEPMIEEEPTPDRSEQAYEAAERKREAIKFGKAKPEKEMKFDTEDEIHYKDLAQQILEAMDETEPTAPGYTEALESYAEATRLHEEGDIAGAIDELEGIADLLEETEASQPEITQEEVEETLTGDEEITESKAKRIRDWLAKHGISGLGREDLETIREEARTAGELSSIFAQWAGGAQFPTPEVEEKIKAGAEWTYGKAAAGAERVAAGGREAAEGVASTAGKAGRGAAQAEQAAAAGAKRAAEAGAAGFQAGARAAAPKVKAAGEKAWRGAEWVEGKVGAKEHWKEFEERKQAHGEWKEKLEQEIEARELAMDPAYQKAESETAWAERAYQTAVKAIERESDNVLKAERRFKMAPDDPEAKIEMQEAYERLALAEDEAKRAKDKFDVASDNQEKVAKERAGIVVPPSRRRELIESEAKGRQRLAELQAKAQELGIPLTETKVVPTASGGKEVREVPRPASELEIEIQKFKALRMERGMVDKELQAQRIGYWAKGGPAREALGVAGHAAEWMSTGQVSYRDKYGRWKRAEQSRRPLVGTVPKQVRGIYPGTTMPTAVQAAPSAGMTGMGIGHLRGYVIETPTLRQSVAGAYAAPQMAQLTRPRTSHLVSSPQMRTFSLGSGELKGEIPQARVMA